MFKPYFHFNLKGMIKIKIKKKLSSDNTIWTVYDIYCYKIDRHSFTEFLIYKDDDWEWVDKSNYMPVEE